MKISEVMRELKAISELHGDLDVHIPDDVSVTSGVRVVDEVELDEDNYVVLR